MEISSVDVKRSSDQSGRVTHSAAEYVRMSTDHQKYSTENQSQEIREYALRRGFKIEKTYADSGKSGLNLDGRDALKQLIDDVQSGNAQFSIIIVYDVSRWGRFQDADESAYYEYICKRAGIRVCYCAEQFENDGSPVSTIVKGVKRAMAEGDLSVEPHQDRHAENGDRVDHDHRQLEQVIVAEHQSRNNRQQQNENRSGPGVAHGPTPASLRCGRAGRRV